MDTESKHASRLLEAIIAANERLIALYQDLRRRPEARGVTHDLDIRGLQTGPVLDAYVEAEMDNDQALCWWLELRWDQEQWFIGADLLLQRDERQERIKEFQATAETLDEVVGQLAKATEALIVWSAEL